MSNLAIRVENLGKMYRIGGKQEKYWTLRDALVDVAAAPFRKVWAIDLADVPMQSASRTRSKDSCFCQVTSERIHGVSTTS